MSERQPELLDAKSFPITSLFEILKKVPRGKKMHFNVVFDPNTSPTLITAYLVNTPIGLRLKIEGLPAQAFNPE